MKKSLFVLLIVSLAVVLVSTSAMAAFRNNNGATCRAANLTQAFELGWDHARVYNPGSRDLWVICPLPYALDADWQSGTGSIFPLDDRWEATLISVYAWFGANAAPAAQVTCIMRDMAPGTVDTAATHSVSHTILQSGGGLPEVVNEVFDVSSFTGGTLTATCKLPPGTGINAVTFGGAQYTNGF